MPWRRGTAKSAKACFEVHERASTWPVWSSPQITLSLLPHTPVNPWGPNSHVQDYPWFPGLPHDVHLRLSNPPRTTLPRIQVTPTARLYAPSPIRLHHSGCPILEQIPGLSCQRILGEIFQGTPGCPLTAPVPQITHPTHLLTQPLPQHTTSHAKTHTPMTLPIYPHHPLVVYSSIYCSVDQKNDLIWNVMYNVYHATTPSTGTSQLSVWNLTIHRNFCFITLA